MTSKHDPWAATPRGYGTPDYGRVRIEWGTVRNENPLAGGWLPATWIDGRETRSPWATRAHDLDRARAMALELAHEQAARFLGDWQIEVVERLNTDAV